MPENGGANFSTLFTPQQVICNFAGTDRNESLRSLLTQLALQRGIGNIDRAFTAIVEREEELCTIVAPGIAMPHARLEAIDQLVVGVMTAPNIDFGGDAPVRLVILILAPKTQPGLYLQAMSSLAKLLQDPTTVDEVNSLTTPEEVWRFFDRGGMILPDHICAGDIMIPVTAALEENDTLEKAITLFVRHRVTDVPVVDKDRELVGVVTAHELLRVCLPDYILWMDDLSPILNFEPFAEILRNESNTWLAEIMCMEFGTVQVDSPAVEVAKEMTRKRIQRIYVLKGKKLVGLVQLEDFLGKVLRE